MKINVTVLILAALMAAVAGCDETLQLDWTDTVGSRGAVWSGIQNRGTLTLINPGAATIPQETVSAGDAMSFILTSKLELDTTTSKLILTTRGKQYDASLTLIEAPFVLPGVRNYRASFTPQNDSPGGVYHISAALWDSAGARPHLTLGKINLTVEADTTPPVVSGIVVFADSAPVRIGGVVTLLFNANEALDTERTQAIFTIAGGQHEQSVTLVPNTEYQYQTTLSVTDAVPDGTLEEVVVIAQDAAGNSGRFTGSANLTVEKVAPPPDTMPPAITNIRIGANSSPIRVGGVVTLSFIANEPLDTENTQTIFTISGSQHVRTVTLVPNTEYQYRTTLNVTDAVPDGTLEEVVVIAQDPAGNSGRFTQSTNLTIEKVAPPPPDTTPPAITNIAVAADSSPIRVGGVVTLSFIANEPLDIAGTRAIFTISGGQHERTVTLVPNTEYEYQTTLSVTDAVPDGTLEEVVVIAQDPAGNSGRFTGSANLTIEKVAPPPPDTTPPAITNIAVSADSAPIRVGGVVTLSFISNEPLDTANTQAIFTIAGSQHEQSVTLVPNTGYQYGTTLSVTDAVPDGTLTEVVVIAQDAAGNKGRFTRSAHLIIEKVAPPPTIIALSAVSDNADSAQAVAGDMVTLSFTTNKPIVLQRSRLTFMTADGTYDRVIQAAAGAANRYTSQLRITDAMAVGAIRASITLTDADGNTSGAIVKNTTVTISKPIITPPPLEPVVHADPKHWRFNTDITFRWLVQYSNQTHGIAQTQGLSNDEILDDYRAGLPGFLNSIGIDGIGTDFDFIFYELYSICLEERPEIAADAVNTGIVIHPIANNRIVFDWTRLGFAYPEKSKEERLLLFRRLVRFWGFEDPEDWWWRTAKIGINELNTGTIVPEESRVYVQPPDNPYTTVTQRQVRRELEQMSQDIQNFLIEYPNIPVVNVYNSGLSTNFGILVDFIFTDLWNIYKEEQPAQASGVAVDDIPLHPINGNGLLVAWLVLQYDNPETSKDERLALFRQLARGGKVQPILEE